MDRLTGLEEFASSWHCQRWCLSWLTAELGVQTQEVLFGRGILGMAIIGSCTSLVAVNRRYAQGALGQAVFAHEVAHVLLHRQRVIMCHGRGATFEEERLAWLGAARLAVSDEQVEAFRSGAHSLYEIAECSGVPIPLARLALHLPPRGKRQRSLPDGSLSIFFRELSWELYEADTSPQMFQLPGDSVAS